MGLLTRYARWLHTGWPAGRVEKLPETDDEGRTRLAGVRVVGDLRGIPLLKLSADSGARAVRAFLDEPDFAGPPPEGGVDLLVIGAGVAGLAAAREAADAGLNVQVLDASERLHTIAGFPKGKPIYTYPADFEPAGSLRIEGEVKESLLEQLQAQTRDISVEIARVDRVAREGGHPVAVLADGSRVHAKRILVAIGRSGEHRRLEVPGEELGKVYHRLFDPADHGGQRVLVVGGGDSAVETALSLLDAGAEVTLSYRQPELTRPKPANLERLEAAKGLTLRLGTRLREIREDSVLLEGASGSETLPNDVVFAMIGRNPPLDFFRKSGLPILGERRLSTWVGLVAFMATCIFIYHWKSSTALAEWVRARGGFPFGWFEGLGSGPLARTLSLTLEEPGFWYSLVYTVCIVSFGIDRMVRKPTPYVRAQTLTLMGFQILPLFLIPYFVLPWMGHAGVFDAGWPKTVADELFPAVSYGQGREYWRAFGLVLAWPLFLWNIFTPAPMVGWLVIGGIQTFVIIPLLVWRFGKGAYCGWICSCGALAETLGDRHRQKMPHGPGWNRLNLLGQVLLGICALLLVARVGSWLAPNTGWGAWLGRAYRLGLSEGEIAGAHVLNYAYLVDLWLAGVLGVGLYFFMSGRTWCRFGCPLAALMHIYARFSRFAIFPEKKKCISCNVCTSVCHQGIDVMGFASRGAPMQDPECVRCSACVQQCPTGVLAFGHVGSDGLVKLDSLRASAVRARNAG